MGYAVKLQGERYPNLLKYNRVAWFTGTTVVDYNDGYYIWHDSQPYIFIYAYYFSSGNTTVPAIERHKDIDIIWQSTAIKDTSTGNSHSTARLALGRIINTASWELRCSPSDWYTMYEITSDAENECFNIIDQTHVGSGIPDQRTLNTSGAKHLLVFGQDYYPGARTTNILPANITGAEPYTVESVSRSGLYSNDRGYFNEIPKFSNTVTIQQKTGFPSNYYYTVGLIAVG